MSQSNNKIMFSFEISEALREKLRLYSFENRLSLSAAARKILSSYLEDQINEKRIENKVKSE